MLSVILDLPSVTRGYALLTPSLRADGTALAKAAADALSGALGLPVEVRGTPLAGAPSRVAGAARVGIPLANGAGAVLEVESRLLAHVLARFTGRAAPTSPALAASDHELAVLALCALVTVAEVRRSGARSLSPLVALDDPPGSPAGCLVIDLELRAGERSGWGRLLLPASALEALRGPPALSSAIAEAVIGASLRQGVITLAPDELGALGAGDVLLVEPATPSAELVVPGGLSFLGRLEAGVHHVEEIRMTEAQASYPIVLSVEIARVRLTLGELARLAPGAAVPLDIRRDGVVALRAGEEVIARGELVEVEGSLGVRIAQVGALR